MSSIYWLLATGFWIVSMIYIRQMAYRHGIWDGAFNQFLPVVQKEMRYYDPHRAAQILDAHSQEPPDA